MSEMEIDFLTNILILTFGAMCIHYVIRAKNISAYFIVNLIAVISLTLITVRKIELALPMLIMIVVWEIRNLRKDSDQ